jgi:hypothetical protein
VETQRARYLDMLMNMAMKAAEANLEGLNESLLDRIERQLDDNGTTERRGPMNDRNYPEPDSE